MQQRNEIALNVFDKIIGRAGLQRGYRDLEILRCRDEYHGRRVGDRPDLLQRFEPIEARHVLIERDRINAALFETLEALGAARRMLDFEAEFRQAAADQPGQCRVVIDIQQRGLRRRHGLAGGTCITEKNRPNCRMALAKLS